MRKDRKKCEGCCGECCWFYGEMTDGMGFCAKKRGEQIDYAYCGSRCNIGAFVSRDDMRHHMAVMLQAIRFGHNPWDHRCPEGDSVPDAIKFGYDYIKTFNKL